MYQSIIEAVARHYGLNTVNIGSPQKGYRNESYRLRLASGELINLIFHKNEANALKRIESADQASYILNEFGAGMPVRTRFDRRILRLSDGKKEVYAGLYIYLPGRTIPWEAYTMDHIKLLGWAMSDMHETWQTWGHNSLPHVADELHPLLERMHRYFDSSDVDQALKKKLGISVIANFTTFASLLGWIDRTTGADDHILHMDLVRGNILFDHAKSSDRWRIDDLALSGVIDFEKAAIGHPVYDIARTLAFLLVDCANKDRRSIYKYFLESGYNKRGASSFKRSDTIGGMPAHKVLNTLVGFFLLHDFYKFLKHTPYESLESNHHFVRTHDILIDYGMLR